MVLEGISGVEESHHCPMVWRDCTISITSLPTTLLFYIFSMLFMYFLWVCIHDCIGAEKGLEEIFHLKMVVTFREQGLRRV